MRELLYMIYLYAWYKIPADPLPGWTRVPTTTDVLFAALEDEK